MKWFVRKRDNFLREPKNFVQKWNNFIRKWNNFWHKFVHGTTRTAQNSFLSNVCHAAKDPEGTPTSDNLRASPHLVQSKNSKVWQRPIGYINFLRGLKHRRSSAPKCGSEWKNRKHGARNSRGWPPRSSRAACRHWYGKLLTDRNRRKLFAYAL